MALNAIRREVKILPGLLQQRAQELLVRTAKLQHERVLAEAKARSGMVPTWVGFGDAAGRPVEQAKKIVVYKYTYLHEIVAELLKALRAASPVESGRYKNGHGLYIDGRPAPENTRLLAGMEVFVANPLPYARRLEVGKTTSGRDFLVSVPNKIYERTAKKFGTKYRNAAKLVFGYVTMPDAYIIQGKLPSHYIAKGGVRRKRRQEVGKEVRAPAIFIERL